MFVVHAIGGVATLEAVEVGVRFFVAQGFDEFCGGEDFATIGFEQFLGTESVGEEHVFKHDICTEDFACAGVGKAWSVSTERGVGRRCPTEDVVANVTGIPVGGIGLFKDLYGVLETDGFEGFVPLEGGLFDGFAVFNGGGIFDPPHDGFYGF